MIKDKTLVDSDANFDSKDLSYIFRSVEEEENELQLPKDSVKIVNVVPTN